MKAKYDEVAKKASFFVKLAIPQVFKDAKKDLLMDKIATGFTSQFGASLDILKNRSITPSMSNKSLSRTALSRRGSIDSTETMSMTKMSTFKQKTILIKDGTINKKDVEFDWRSRL